jgi:hypothetical protein
VVGGAQTRRRREGKAEKEGSEDGADEDIVVEA